LTIDSQRHPSMMNVLRRVCIGATLAIGAAALLAATSSCRSDKAVAQEEEVARVNDVPITHRQLVVELRARRGKPVLEQMIAETLIRQRAQELGLSETREDIDRAYERAVSMAGSPGDLERQLQRQGITKQAYRESLVSGVLLDKIIAETVAVSDAEIKAYYDAHIDEYRHPERVRARLMMLETRENADELRKVLDMEESDFAGLATAFSIDPGTKDEGGDTGLFPREGYYAEEIASRAFAMGVGETSEVFEAPDGFCILKTIERRPPEVQPLAEVRDMVRSRVAYEKQEEMRQSWLVDERKKASVDIRDPELQ
jgi:foldase protein PrsA